MEVLEKAYIVSPYSEDRGAYSHTGVDVLSGTGNRRVRAIKRGTVIEVRNSMPDDYIVNQSSPVSEWAGNYVILQHEDGYTSRYSHLKYQSFNLNVGDIVEGEFSEEGYSGFATGVHVDLEIKKDGKFIDPTEYALGHAELPDGNKYLNLSPEADTWRVYPMNVAPVVGNECKKLLPKQFGGLSYTVNGYTVDNVAIIETRDFGQVQIYTAHELASITDSPVYGLVK